MFKPSVSVFSRSKNGLDVHFKGIENTYIRKCNFLI